MSRLLDRYKTEIIKDLQKELEIDSVMAVPRLEKIVINVGAGDAIQNIKLLDAAKVELSLISGQYPAVGRAKKSISAFKLRKGQPIACYVTLRRARMYEFLTAWSTSFCPVSGIFGESRQPVLMDAGITLLA